MDDLHRLKELLDERAAEVPSAQRAPRRTLARARRRLARNALAGVLAVGLIVAGTSAALGNLGALHSTTRPGASHTPGSSGVCMARDLRATPALQGATGSVLGGILVMNTSEEACTLSGRPQIGIFSATGSPVPVQLSDVEPQWRADAAPRPAGWPVVRLRPGAEASIRFRWTNACPQLTGSARIRVDLHGEPIPVRGTAFPPPCNGPGYPSNLEIGPFEPAPSS